MKKFFALIILSLICFTSELFAQKTLSTVDGIEYSITIEKSNLCYFTPYYSEKFKKNNTVEIKLALRRKTESSSTTHHIQIAMDDFEPNLDSHLSFDIGLNFGANTVKSVTGTVTYTALEEVQDYLAKIIITPTGGESDTVKVQKRLQKASVPVVMQYFAPSVKDDFVKIENVSWNGKLVSTLLISPYDSLQNKKDRAWFNYAGWLFNDLEYEHEYS
ncbi:MAG: hypothetical protein ACRCZB_00455, partial [Bacteroidales bacterium]